MPETLGNEAPMPAKGVRTVEAINAEISKLEAIIAKVEKGYWKAGAAIKRHGLEVLVPLIDKDRKVTNKLRPNPAIRLQRAAREAMKGMREDIARLRDEIAAIEKATADKQLSDKYAFLDLKRRHHDEKGNGSNGTGQGGASVGSTAASATPGAGANATTPNL